MSIQIRLPELDPVTESPDECPLELIFMADTSGSMSGSNINNMKNALQVFLRALPTTCLFNMVEFNSRYTSLFAAPQPYSDATLNAATQWVNRLQAGGGTELREAIEVRKFFVAGGLSLIRKRETLMLVLLFPS